MADWMNIDKTPSWGIKIKVQIDRIVENIQKIPEKVDYLVRLMNRKPRFLI